MKPKLPLNESKGIHIFAPIHKTKRSSYDVIYLIDAPKLEQFNVNGYIALYDFVTVPPNLQDVKIDVDDQLYHVEHGELLGLIKEISCVRSLVLHYEPCLLKILSNLDDIPIFCNLVHLRFRSNCDEWKVPLPDYLLGNLKRHRRI